METYTTVQGDMWDSIAYRVYGSEKHMDVLMRANMELLEIFVFGAGVVLAVPEIHAEEEADMPPWR
ncbi:phage tail protein [bacterium D16-50]|nr:phage tail protein [bacterium D16-50]